jgi:hypothetical protein
VVGVEGVAAAAGGGAAAVVGVAVAVVALVGGTDGALWVVEVLCVAVLT